jgi:hypothetical protein
MMPVLAKLTREAWGVLQLGCFLVFALIVFCAIPKRRNEMEEIK